MHRISKKKLYAAHLSRDPRFDGKFFVGVKTTKIYCRPICPARKAKLENLTFFELAEQAEERGFRPCLKCRPETAPHSAAWLGTSSTVKRALRIMESSAVDELSIAKLASYLGIGERWLHELFVMQLGVSPQKVLITKKLDTARRLLDETSFQITEIAFNSGFRSIRRFNDSFKERFGQSPSKFRRKKSRGKNDQLSVKNRLKLSFRPPFDWQALLSFLRGRSLFGMEQIDGDTYLRTVCLPQANGWMAVRPDSDHSRLIVDFEFDGPANLVEFVSRVRCLFDLDADPVQVEATLKKDKGLRPFIKQYSGLRVPGCWDGFEAAVRAVVGQQISVKGARTILERLIARCGDGFEVHERGLKYSFPTPASVLDADLEGIGLTRSRLNTLKALARCVEAGEIELNNTADFDETCRALLEVKGIGPWTVEYIAMRALRNPNAFPETDLEIKKQVARFNLDPAKWEPWKAYAAATLWHVSAMQKKEE